MRFLCFAHNGVYYRRFVVKNSENIPQQGMPTLIIANHQNGMMDAMAILHTLYRIDKRQPVFIARGDIFKKDSVAKVLRFLKILPVFRNRDGRREDIKKDLDIFNIAAKVLCNNGTLVIFPEAGHQQGHYLSTFKKGFPRIAFTAEELKDFKLGVQILPINIHYSNYFEFRSDLVVTCGKPFSYDEFFEIYKESPNQAYINLNEKARFIVKSMTPDIDIPEYYSEIDAITQIVSEHLLKRKGLVNYGLSDKKDSSMEIIAAVRNLRDDRVEDFEKLMFITKEYLCLLKEKSITDWAVNREISKHKLILYVLMLIVASPFALFGLINNFIPSTLLNTIVGKIKDPMMRSTFQYAIGTAIVIPIWYLILLILVSVLSKSFVFGLTYAIFSGICGLFYRSYKRNFGKMLSVIRLKSIKRETFNKTSALKSNIISLVESVLF